MTPGYLGKKDACTYLGGMSLATLDRAMRDGLRPAGRTRQRGAVLFRISDLDEWVARHAAPVIEEHGPLRNFQLDEPPKKRPIQKHARKSNLEASSSVVL